MKVRQIAFEDLNKVLVRAVDISLQPGPGGARMLAKSVLMIDSK